MSVLAAKSRFFFNLRGVPILNQLCFEELLLRTTEANWLAALLHILLAAFTLQVPTGLFLLLLC